MKQLFFFALLIFALNSCGNKAKIDKVESVAQSDAIETVNVASYELDDLLASAEEEVDKTVKVTGYVTHTCKHAGKRCFIVGESQKVSMRIEAKGNIGGFNRELAGSKIEITGILKENRLSSEYIDQMEKDVNLKKEEDGSVESCEAELSNISSWRQWMKENNKDYYSVYYMDGLEYEVLD